MELARLLWLEVQGVIINHYILPLVKSNLPRSEEKYNRSAMLRACSKGFWAGDCIGQAAEGLGIDRDRRRHVGTQGGHRKRGRRPFGEEEPGGYPRGSGART